MLGYSFVYDVWKRFAVQFDKCKGSRWKSRWVPGDTVILLTSAEPACELPSTGQIRMALGFSVGAASDCYGVSEYLEPFYVMARRLAVSAVVISHITRCSLTVRCLAKCRLVRDLSVMP